MMANLARFSAAPRVREVTALRYGAIHERVLAEHAARDVSLASFRAHLIAIRARGWAVTSIRDLLDANGGRAAPPSGHAVALTFDHGLASHADPVLPALWERRLPADFFVHPANVGRRGFLGWSELRGMASAGMSIQLQAMPPADSAPVRITQELTRARGMLEDRIGFEVTLLGTAGRSPGRSFVERALAAGFRAVCVDRPGRWQPGEQKVVPRFSVRGNTSCVMLRDWMENRAMAVAAEYCRFCTQKIARGLFGQLEEEALGAPGRREA